MALSPSAPDEPVFAASRGTTGITLMRQLRLLLSDTRWRYSWASRPRPASGRQYLLWRKALDSEEQRRVEEKRLRERLASLLGWLDASPAELEELASEDPELAAELKQPAYRARLELLGRLSPDQLDRVIAGQPLRAPVSGLGADEQRLALAMVGRTGNATITDAAGNTRVLFDARELASKGELEIRSDTRVDGVRTLSVRVSTERGAPGETQAQFGGDALHPPREAEFADRRAANEAAKRRREATALSKISRGAKTVTIPADAETRPDEVALAAYLRELSRQTGLTLLAYWPAKAPEARRRLPGPIVKKPVAVALDRLCAHARCEWVRDGRVIRIRYRGRAAQAPAAGQGGREPARDRSLRH
jgi:hypothetical protein